MSVPSEITLTVAIIGAVLGIFNTWRQISKDRVRLRVIPKLAFQIASRATMSAAQLTDGVKQRLIAGEVPRLQIEIINLSAFAVTVSNAGWGIFSDEELTCTSQPYLPAGQTWPSRLEPRQSVTLEFQPGVAPDERIEAIAYATTDCGHTFYGKSPVFTEYMKWRHGRQ
jgi:hypothetical protein